MGKATKPEQMSAKAAAYEDYDRWTGARGFALTMLSVFLMGSSIVCIGFKINYGENVSNIFGNLFVIYSAVGMLAAFYFCYRLTLLIRGYKVSTGLVGVDFLFALVLVIAGSAIVLMSSINRHWELRGAGTSLKFVSVTLVTFTLFLVLFFLGIAFTKPTTFLKYLAFTKRRGAAAAAEDGLEMGSLPPISSGRGQKAACCNAKAKSIDASTMTPMPAKTASKMTSPVGQIEICHDADCCIGGGGGDARRSVTVGDKKFTTPGGGLGMMVRVSESDLDTAKKNLRRTSATGSIDSMYGLAHLHLPRMMPIVVEDIIDECKSNLENDLNAQEDVDHDARAADTKNQDSSEAAAAATTAEDDSKPIIETITNQSESSDNDCVFVQERDPSSDVADGATSSKAATQNTKVTDQNLTVKGVFLKVDLNNNGGSSSDGGGAKISATSEASIHTPTMTPPPVPDCTPQSDAATYAASKVKEANSKVASSADDLEGPPPPPYNEVEQHQQQPSSPRAFTSQRSPLDSTSSRHSERYIS